MITSIDVAGWLREAGADDQVEIADVDPWLVARARMPQDMHVTLRVPKYGDADVLVCLGPKPIDKDEDIVVKIECPPGMVVCILDWLNAADLFST